jgi:hypothetical protein
VSVREPKQWKYLPARHVETLDATIATLAADLAAERALTDQMARALAAVKADRPSVHTHEVWTAVCDALDDYGKARRG